MEILTRGKTLPAVLSYGGIHTNHEKSVVEQARHAPLLWRHAYLFTGMSAAALKQAGVPTGIARRARPVTARGAGVWRFHRVVLPGRSRRSGRVGNGARSAQGLRRRQAGQRLRSPRPRPKRSVARARSTCCARVPPTSASPWRSAQRRPTPISRSTASPTIWVRDGYAAMEAIDGEILSDCCEALKMEPHWQYLSSGGSDASCAADKGLTARPVILGLPVENSHGFEIMHRDAPREMLRLLLAYVRSSERSNPHLRALAGRGGPFHQYPGLNYPEYISYAGHERSRIIQQ